MIERTSVYDVLKGCSLLSIYPISFTREFKLRTDNSHKEHDFMRHQLVAKSTPRKPTNSLLSNYNMTLKHKYKKES
jgi:hypothetical protein